MKLIEFRDPFILDYKRRRVIYCFRKLTAKIVRRISLDIIYEVENYNSLKNDEWIKRGFHVFYTRIATENEVFDFDLSNNTCNRTFLIYTDFLDSKRLKKI